MSDVINFLERMGQDANLRFGDKDSLEHAMSVSNISFELREALATGDQKRLETLLGAKSNMCAMIFPVESDDPAEPQASIRMAKVAG